MEASLFSSLGTDCAPPRAGVSLTHLPPGPGQGWHTEGTPRCARASGRAGSVEGGSTQAQGPGGSSISPGLVTVLFWLLVPACSDTHLPSNQNLLEIRPPWDSASASQSFREPVGEHFRDRRVPVKRPGHTTKQMPPWLKGKEASWHSAHCSFLLLCPQTSHLGTQVYRIQGFGDPAKRQGTKGRVGLLFSKCLDTSLGLRAPVLGPSPVWRSAGQCKVG